MGSLSGGPRGNRFFKSCEHPHRQQQREMHNATVQRTSASRTWFMTCGIMAWEAVPFLTTHLGKLPPTSVTNRYVHMEDLPPS